MEIESVLNSFAELNRYGFAFLLSFGVTWLACGVFWIKTSESTAGYATLFQGLIALPAALFISYSTGALTERPGGDIFTELVMTIAMSQMLILPLIIVMQAKNTTASFPLSSVRHSPSTSSCISGCTRPGFTLRCRSSLQQGLL